MNLHEYILDNDLADTDSEVIAASYIKAVLALDDADEQLSALEPSVRAHAGRLASMVRRAQRSHGPAHNGNDSEVPHGVARANAEFVAGMHGPAQSASGSKGSYGGPANPGDDSKAQNGGPAMPAWAQENATLIAWCREHASDNFWIPGAGRRKLAEITAPQWEARARQLAEQAKGTAKAASRMREYAALIAAAGTETIGEILEKVAV